MLIKEITAMSESSSSFQQENATAQRAFEAADAHCRCPACLVGHAHFLANCSNQKMQHGQQMISGLTL